MILSKNKNFRKNCQTIWFLVVTFWQTDSWPPGDCQPIVWMVCWWKGRYFLRLYTIASRIRLRTVYTGIADTLTIVRCKELYALAEFREQEYGYYDINLLGICLTTIMPIRGKQRAHDGQAPCPSWAELMSDRCPKTSFPLISKPSRQFKTTIWSRTVCTSMRYGENLIIWQFWLFFWKYHIYGELGVNSHPPNQPHPWT